MICIGLSILTLISAKPPDTDLSNPGGLFKSSFNNNFNSIVIVWWLCGVGPSFKIQLALSQTSEVHNAQKWCDIDGIHSLLGMTIELVSVWNAYENSFLKAMFWPEVDFDYAWIGLYYNHVSFYSGKPDFTSCVVHFYWDQSLLENIN